MGHPDKLLEKLHSELQAGRSAVRAVIAKTWGSTPRETGASMVFDQVGGLYGTVGGGCGEAEVYELAQSLLSDGSSLSGALLHIDLTENPEDGGGKVCGGRFDVLLHRYEPDEPESEVVREALQLLEQGQSIALGTSIGEYSPGLWKQGVVCQHLIPRLALCETGGADPLWDCKTGESTFVEPLGLTQRLVIVGAGHIARPLCEMAALADYAVTVVDDRAEYALEEFFPRAKRVLCGAYEDLLPELAKISDTSVVLVTRGHRHDQECLRLIAGDDLNYVGMIGSQRRIDAVFGDLVSEGIDPKELRKVAAPIGLEIGARTPAEIAISILAQMIQWRRSPLHPGDRRAIPRRRHQRTLKD